MFSQPKLDGIRCIARKDGLWTRSGKEIVSCPHIQDELNEFFKLHPEAILDGELYNHELKDDFNKITSLVRKEKPTEEDLQETKNMVEYHVYDRADHIGDYYERMNEPCMCNNIEGTHIKRVHINIVETKKELDDRYEEYLEQGYEGQMIRLNEPYQQNKRSKYLMKRKEFITEEFPVHSFSEGGGNWSGTVKKFHLTDVNDGGKVVDAGVRGSRDKLKKLLDDGIVPKWATLRYFGKTPDGNYRFPVVIDYGFNEKRQD